jgi:cytoskeletal protein CcmA (bactofilin family)
MKREDPQMADAADDRGFLVKPVSPADAVAMPPRAGEALRRFTDLAYPPEPDDGSRCLSVGRGITLSGDVTSCDKLFIEGIVDAKLTNCRIIEIAEGGLFRGSTTIDEADVRGRFEGDLVVHNRLLIRATGRVSGSIRYGQIEIECGGQIFGNIQAPSTGDVRENLPWLSSPMGGPLP